MFHPRFIAFLPSLPFPSLRPLLQVPLVSAAPRDVSLISLTMGLQKSCLKPKANHTAAVVTWLVLRDVVWAPNDHHYRTLYHYTGPLSPTQQWRALISATEP